MVDEKNASEVAWARQAAIREDDEGGFPEGTGSVRLHRDDPAALVQKAERPSLSANEKDEDWVRGAAEFEDAAGGFQPAGGVRRQ